MSPLSSRELLRAFVIDGALPTIDTIIQEELDVELLEALVSKLKPNMDYLRGYKSLDSWFTQTALIPNRTWLEEAGLTDRYLYCINVLDTGMKDHNGENWLPLAPSEEGRYPGEEKRYARLGAWLTRKSEWIVWTNHPTSTFRVVGSVKAAIGTVKELTPEGVILTDARGMLLSPALCAFAELQEFLRASIARKRQAVLQDKDVLKFADTLLSRLQS
jgi:hypothetical protein